MCCSCCSSLYRVCCCCRCLSHDSAASCLAGSLVSSRPQCVSDDRVVALVRFVPVVSRGRGRVVAGRGVVRLASSLVATVSVGCCSAFAQPHATRLSAENRRRDGARWTPMRTITRRKEMINAAHNSEKEPAQRRCSFCSFPRGGLALLRRTMHTKKRETFDALEKLRQILSATRFCCDCLRCCLAPRRRRTGADCKRAMLGPALRVVPSLCVTACRPCALPRSVRSLCSPQQPTCARRGSAPLAECGERRDAALHPDS